MQPHLLAALFALRAAAAPQPACQAPRSGPDMMVLDGIEIDSSFILEPIFEILYNYTIEAETGELVGRQAPNPAKAVTMTAEAVSKIPAPGGGEKGVFYRGDSRPPSVVFNEGFAPQGNNLVLRNHLNFAGSSGFVSVSRSPESAEAYAFGRTGSRTPTGYLYVIAPKDVPDGYWVPGIYKPEKNPSVAKNQEFAVAGRVPPSSISHAYELSVDSPGVRGQKIKNPDYILRKAPSCFRHKKRALCDPGKFTEKAALASRQTKPKLLPGWRASLRVGGPIAFAVLSPHAHDLLDLIKGWDNPIGHAVKWFDDAIASLQEAIGGPQVPEIYGNTLKLRIICWFRGSPRWKNDVDRACDRLRESQKPRPVESDESRRTKAINKLLDACEKADQPDAVMANEEFKAELLRRCEAFRDKVEEQDTASA